MQSGSEAIVAHAVDHAASGQRHYSILGPAGDVVLVGKFNTVAVLRKLLCVHAHGAAQHHCDLLSANRRERRRLAIVALQHPCSGELVDGIGIPSIGRHIGEGLRALFGVAHHIGQHHSEFCAGHFIVWVEMSVLVAVEDLSCIPANNRILRPVALYIIQSCLGRSRHGAHCNPGRQRQRKKLLCVHGSLLF